MNNKPLLTNEYINNAGVTYLFEYHECDSFDDLPQKDIRQCYAVAFHKDKFLAVNTKVSGQYGLIGGTVEDGESIKETLLRELKEEGNMKVLIFKPIGYQKVITKDGSVDDFYQLRFYCEVEPYGPFEGDPDGTVTELVECTRDNYKEYFDWGEIGQRIIDRAYEYKGI